MGLQRLVVPSAQWPTGPGPLRLSPEQSHYLTRVLRLGKGDRFIALNGQDSAWLVELTGPDEAQLIEATGCHEPPERALTLFCALPKQGFDEVVRQCTELGVDRIVPLLSERTLLRPAPQKLERWRRIMAEAAEQSERLRLPELAEPQDWKTALGDAQSLPLKGVCWARSQAPLLNQWLLLQDPQEPLGLAVGPEGGWSDREVQQAIEADWQPLRLGRQVLRAVTAAPTAIALARSV